MPRKGDGQFLGSNMGWRIGYDAEGEVGSMQ